LVSDGGYSQADHVFFSLISYLRELTAKWFLTKTKDIARNADFVEDMIRLCER